MTNKLFLLSLFIITTSAALAGGLLTNTNQSVHFLRNPARDASTEIDAVYTNPAGLTFLSEGFHFSVTNQSVFQTRTINSTFAPYATANAGNSTKIFKGEASAPLVPSFQLAYKKNSFVFSASGAITGGGGKATFNNGLPSFEAPISMIPLSLSAKGVNTKLYSVDSYMEGRQYIFGLQLNGSYKFSNSFSGAVGFRMNIVNNGYKGHLTNIMINPVHPTLNPTGAMMLANTFFNNAATAAQNVSNSLAPLASSTAALSTLLPASQISQLSAGVGRDVSALKASQVQAMYNAAAASYTTSAIGTADKQLDCTQSGWGVTPILSLNYHVENLNLAAKYEFKSALNVQNKTIVDNTGLYADGVNTPHDIPALLTVGMEYQLSKKLKLSGGYHHFFDSDAKMANDKQKYIYGGVSEFLFGTEYAINDVFLLSAGAQVTQTGVSDEYQKDLSFSLDSYSVGFGGAIKITPDLRLNIAYFFTNYSDWTKVSTNYNNIAPVTSPKEGTDVFSRTNKVIGIGIDYKF